MITSVEVSTPYLTVHQRNVILMERSIVAVSGDGVEIQYINAAVRDVLTTEM